MDIQISGKQSLACSFQNSLDRMSKLMNMDLSMTPWYSTTLALIKVHASSLTNVEVWLTPETSLDSYATLNLFCVVLDSNADVQKWEIKVPMKELLELIQLLPLQTLIDAMRSYVPTLRYKDDVSTYTSYKGYHITTSKKKYNFFGSSLLHTCPKGMRNLTNASLSALYNTMKAETFKHWIVDDIYMDKWIEHECGKVIALCSCDTKMKHWHVMCTTIPHSVRKLQKIRSDYIPRIKPRCHPIQGFKIECINHFKNMYHYIMNNTGGHVDAQNMGKQLNKTSHKHINCCSTYSGILASNKALTEYGFNHDLTTCSCNWAKKQRFYAAIKKAPPKSMIKERELFLKDADYANKQYTAEKCFPNWDLNLKVPKRSELDISTLFNNKKF
jgi:hypothetical protein